MGTNSKPLNSGVSDAPNKQVIPESINKLKREDVNVYKRLQNPLSEEITIPVSFRISASTYILYKSLRKRRKKAIKKVLEETIRKLAEVSDSPKDSMVVNVPISISVAEAKATTVVNGGVDISLLKERNEVLKQQLKEAKELLKYYKGKCEQYRRVIQQLRIILSKNDIYTAKIIMNKFRG